MAKQQPIVLPNSTENAAQEDSMPSNFDFPPPPDADRSFSGRLPFRTNPDVHRSIYLAAQQSGKSINSWMEAALREAAQRQLQEDTSAPVNLSLQSIQQVIRDHPAAIADLVDDIKPLLKSQKTLIVFEFLSAFEKLVESWVALKPCMRRSDAKSVVELVHDIVASVKPHLTAQDTEAFFSLMAAFKLVEEGKVVLQQCVKNESPDVTVIILTRILRTLNELDSLP